MSETMALAAPRCRFHVGIDMVEIGASVEMSEDAPMMVNWRCPVSGCPHVAQSCRAIERERLCARCGKRAQTSYIGDRYCYKCQRYFNKEYEQGRTPVRVLGHQIRAQRRRMGVAREVFKKDSSLVFSPNRRLPTDIRLSQ